MGFVLAFSAVFGTFFEKVKNPKNDRLVDLNFFKKNRKKNSKKSKKSR
jgi:hypothetical protein